MSLSESVISSMSNLSLIIPQIVEFKNHQSSANSPVLLAFIKLSAKNNPTDVKNHSSTCLCSNCGSFSHIFSSDHSYTNTQSNIVSVPSSDHTSFEY